MVTKKENKYMSRWTHVAAIFRIDSIGEISDNEIIEKFETPKSCGMMMA